MAEPKTKATSLSVASFLKTLPENRKADTVTIVKLMAEITNNKPVMWGSSIIGFGKCQYVYASGRKGDWPIVGVSPRKQSLSLYII